MSFAVTSFDEMPFDEMSFDETSFDEMSFIENKTGQWSALNGDVTGRGFEEIPKDEGNPEEPPVVGGEVEWYLRRRPRW